MIPRKDAWLGWLVVSIALSAVTPSVASAASYSVVLPSAPAAGGQRTEITATITNLAQTEQLASADLTAPPGIVLREASPLAAPPAATASIAGNVIRLRDDSLAPGATRSIRIAFDAPCRQGRLNWAIVAKQSPDFGGPIDLSLERSASALRTATRGLCRLAFVSQPADVKVGQAITTLPFDPTGPPVAVALLDARGQVSARSGERVTVRLALGSWWGQLSGRKTVSAVDGVAVFPGIAIGRPGRYLLTASSPGVRPRISKRFHAEQVAILCRNGVACAATATRTGIFGARSRSYFVRAEMDAPQNPDVRDDGGLLTLSFDTELPLDCAGYAERSPATAVVLGLNRRKVVKMTIDKALLAANPGTLQMCVGVPYRFRTRPHTAAATPSDSDGDGVKDQWVGQLPTCYARYRGGRFRPPCVSRRGKDPAGNPFMVARLKASPVDPRLRH